MNFNFTGPDAHGQLSLRAQVDESNIVDGSDQVEWAINFSPSVAALIADDLITPHTGLRLHPAGGALNKLDDAGVEVLMAGTQWDDAPGLLLLTRAPYNEELRVVYHVNDLPGEEAQEVAGMLRAYARKAAPTI